MNGTDFMCACVLTVILKTSKKTFFPRLHLNWENLSMYTESGNYALVYLIIQQRRTWRHNFKRNPTTTATPPALFILCSRMRSIFVLVGGELFPFTYSTSSIVSSPIIWNVCKTRRKCHIHARKCSSFALTLKNHKHTHAELSQRRENMFWHGCLREFTTKMISLVVPVTLLSPSDFEIALSIIIHEKCLAKRTRWLYEL